MSSLDPILSTPGHGPLLTSEQLASAEDSAEFESLLINDTNFSYDEFERRFERNFQTQSYLFLKGVFDYAESEIKRRG
ncbi:hypothetical protein [Roseiconus lacunae]|uniref:hypothetical protein n=1 Tax=Roseiconus lacunae TaxID=2605694 RepID=UPI001E55FE85|nr:hypothetical protein [Roseiconus lacunae]MCD0457891.1 hypothetical protein [Roseiconus lacunae]